MRPHPHRPSTFADAPIPTLLPSFLAMPRTRSASIRCCQLILCLGLGLSMTLALNGGRMAIAQTPAAPSPTPAIASPSPVPAGITLPKALPKPAILAPGTPGQYVLEFNRSPVVGNRFRFDGIYDEARLRFTRPQHWNLKTVKVLLRYRHSPALYATRSNLTVLINGTSVGSVPMNQPINKVGNVVFDVPVDLLQNQNELVVAALQNNSPTCTQDPFDPSLWSEVLPDSKLVFDFQPQPVAMDFSRYPYPIFDDLSLESNRVAYLQPNAIDETWLTAATRFHTSLGRWADYRELDNRIVQTLDQVAAEERLIVIGTPASQPALSTLNLPLPLQGDRLQDGNGKPLSPNVGVLMLTTAGKGRVPVLIATGNGNEGVAKAVQFLAQNQTRQMGSGQAILVNQVTSVEPPPLRQWQGYLPLENAFQLKDLKTYDNQPYGDVTVRGSHSPALEFPFRALPDDRFLPGNLMTLRYSYGPQINPLTSMVEVQLDGVAVDGARLTSVTGAKEETLQVKLPEDRITPHSKIQVNFRLDPRERRSCSRVTDEQLWGTVHADTHFELQRETVAQLPNLKLLTNGFPFTAPQDLSRTAIALPDQPNATDLNLMLEVGERLGRLSKATSTQVNVYRVSQLPQKTRQNFHLIGIGDRSKFPFPEALRDVEGFSLKPNATRTWENNQVQIVRDVEGVIQQTISPWNGDRVLLSLSAQSANSLEQVRALFSEDPLFYQLKGDTVLISSNTAQPSAYNPNDYNLEFLQNSPKKAIATSNPMHNLFVRLQRSWVVLAPALVVSALVLYGVAQQALNRLSPHIRD